MLVALLTSAGVVPGVAPTLDAAHAARALDHGLGPYLGRRVLDGHARATPAAAEVLVASHRACAAEALVRGRAVDDALALLRRRRIPVTLLKAAALDHVVYGLPGLRPRADVDVLVPPARFPEALRALAAHGARVLGPPRRPVTLALFHERAVALPGGGELDVHRYVTNRPLLVGLEERLRARARLVDEGLYVPAPEELLLLGAVAAAQDGMRAPLRAALDAALLLGRGDLRSGRVVETAIAVGAAGAMSGWLDGLADLGVEPLGAPPWRQARATLRRLRRPWTPRLTWGPATAAGLRRGLVSSFDAPERALALVAYRSTSRALDWIVGRAVSRRLSGTTLPSAR